MGKAGIEHKINEFGRKRSRMPQVEELSDPR
jgi:hypothetical protein